MAEDLEHSGAEAPLVNVYTTFGDEASARAIVERLLAGGTIACANLWPMRSLYRWEGRMHDEAEVAVLLKTTQDEVADVLQVLAEHHPYDVPCAEVLPVTGCHPPFGAWVRSETGSAP